LGAVSPMRAVACCVGAEHRSRRERGAFARSQRASPGTGELSPASRTSARSGWRSRARGGCWGPRGRRPSSACSGGQAAARCEPPRAGDRAAGTTQNKHQRWGQNEGCTSGLFLHQRKSFGNAVRGGRPGPILRMSHAQSPPCYVPGRTMIEAILIVSTSS